MDAGDKAHKQGIDIRTYVLQKFKEKIQLFACYKIMSRNHLLPRLFIFNKTTQLKDNISRPLNVKVKENRMDPPNNQKIADKLFVMESASKIE